MADNHSNEIIAMEEQKSEVVLFARNVRKHYGYDYNKKEVLKGLNMTVEKGTIYGLLGASGCGKTTTLACIAGTLKINGGNIWVFGGAPGSKESGVPGPTIGYMPQELALIETFTIEENLKFFCLLSGRKSSFIKEKVNHLIEVLDLPSKSRMANTLSGGQRRRLSLAIALVHEPELLVLDEPTVGVDPLLRTSIWDYLLKICNERKVTIILTTHYIEEANQAHKLGLLRNGVMLAEDSPSNLLAISGVDSLEDAFLKLSQKQSSYEEREEIIEIEENECKQNGEITVDNNDRDTTKVDQFICEQRKHLPKIRRVSNNKRIIVIVWKQVLAIKRNLTTLIFLLALPIIQVNLFCFCVGRTPTSLRMGYVNDELPFDMECQSLKEAEQSCPPRSLSCQYLKILEEPSMFSLKRYKHLDDARNEVKRGYSWGVLYFNENFTFNTLERIEGMFAERKNPLEFSNVDAELDASNKIVLDLATNSIYDTYMKMLQKLADDCQWSVRSVAYPYAFQDYVYGIDDFAFINFCIPALLTTLAFMSTANAVGAGILHDRNEKITERLLVNGVGNYEIHMAHFITGLFIMLTQYFVCFFLIFGVFNYQQNGEWITIAMLSMLNGCASVTFGMMLATVMPHLQAFTQGSLFYNTMGIMLSGCVWPLEGMHYIARYVSYLLPWSFVTEGYRSILYRGWTITDSTVTHAFIAAIAWGIIFMILTVLIHKLKLKSL